MKFMTLTIAAILATLAIATPMGNGAEESSELVKRNCSTCRNGKRTCCYSSGDIGSICSEYDC
jgi:hypothetical protein